MRLVPVLVLLAAGCAFDAPPANPPIPDRAMFEAEVYPILMRDCGFPDCHGNRGRFFRVYGLGRLRLDPEQGIDDELSAAERSENYERARSMLGSARTAEETLLVRKPLEIGAGGAPHLGIDDYGQDVYASTEDLSYQALLTWARTGIPEESE